MRTPPHLEASHVQLIGQEGHLQGHTHNNCVNTSWCTACSRHKGGYPSQMPLVSSHMHQVMASYHTAV
jgi:hypothetical protein